MSSLETRKLSRFETHNKIQVMVVTALFIALTYVGCMIHIQLPFGGKGGLIHLGNIPLFVGAILFGRKTGAIAGGVGMALFDLLSPYASWAPFTFIIVATMGYVTGWGAERKKGMLWYVIFMLAALVIKLVGYYFAEVVLYGNWVVPVGSIPGNIIQVGTAIVVVSIMIRPLEGIMRQVRK